MPKPRYTQVSLEATPYYHCTSRCVRRAFLCGIDTLTQKSFEHRRQWLEEKLLALGGLFALDICAHVRKACNAMGKNWVHGRGQCEKYFSSS